jgi:hypothetical protein
MEWLAEHRPELVELYENLYRRGAYAPAEERRRLARLIDGPQLTPAERTWRLAQAAETKTARSVRRFEVPAAPRLF